MTLQTRWPIRLGGAILAVSLAVVAGCGLTGNEVFANRVVGTDGQQFVVEDLEAIASDASLTSEEKKQQFRDLGIEDEKLINALLGL